MLKIAAIVEMMRGAAGSLAQSEGHFVLGAGTNYDAAAEPWYVIVTNTQEDGATDEWYLSFEPYAEENTQLHTPARQRSVRNA